MNHVVQFDNFEVASQDGLVSLTGIFDRATAIGIAGGKQSPYEWSRRDGVTLAKLCYRHKQSFDIFCAGRFFHSQIIKLLISKVRFVFIAKLC